MKKIFLVAFVVAVLFSRENVSAQITLEHSYVPVGFPFVKYFNHHTPKWQIHDTNFVYLYNLNHSLYMQFPNYGGGYVFYLSDDLFDNDSTNLEFLTFRGGANDTVKVYREDGTLLFWRDSTINFFTAVTGDYDYRPIVMTGDSGTKLRLAIQNSPNSRYEIYSLPGTLPCFNPCAENITGIQSPDRSGSYLKNPYPNPSGEQTHIPYQLPPGETEGEIIFYDMTGAEVKRYKVNWAFQELILSTADLSAGSYYYQLQTPRYNSEGKKLIVIK